MNTLPAAWLEQQADTAAHHHPATRVRQTPHQGAEGCTPAHSATNSVETTMQHESFTLSHVRPTLPGPAVATVGVNDGKPYLHSTHTYSADRYGGTDVHYLDDVAERGPVSVEELAFGAPGLAEAMVHQQATARESAERKLDEERARCELLQHEIHRLQGQLTGRDVEWKCPICCAIFPRTEKDEHGKRCLMQFVEFVQTGSPGAAAGGRQR